MHERQREVEAALHPAGIGADLAVRSLGQADAREQLVAAALTFFAGDAVHRRLQAEMLTTGEVRVERRFLERRADDLPHRRPLPDDVIAADGRRACGRREQRREHVHRRRLARTVGAEKAVDLARVDVQVDAVDRTRALLELTDEAVGLDAVRPGSHPREATEGRVPVEARTRPR